MPYTKIDPLNRRFRLHKPSSEFAGLHLQSLSGVEGLSQLFSFNAELICVTNPDVFVGSDILAKGRDIANQHVSKIGNLAGTAVSGLATTAAGAVAYKSISKNIKDKNKLLKPLVSGLGASLAASAASELTNKALSELSKNKKNATSISEKGKVDASDLMDLLGDPNTIDPKSIIGKPITIRADLINGSTRYFNGMVSHFKLINIFQNHIVYEAIIKPRIWLAKKSSDCRVFKEKTVPDIVSEVLKSYGVSKIRLTLERNYQVWDYCVQYRETDFNFISRLLEQEGIYYYFIHEETEHVLVLADAPSAHNALPDKNSIPYRTLADNASSAMPSMIGDVYQLNHETLDVPNGFANTSNLANALKNTLVGDINKGCFSHWSGENEVRPSAYATNDFDFTAPKKKLLKSEESSEENTDRLLEIYDYPGEYTDSDIGEQYAKTRLEEMQLWSEVFSGCSDEEAMRVGYTFNLYGYPIASQNITYLAVFVEYNIDNSGLTIDIDREENFTTNVKAIDAKRYYRPVRSSIKPTVRGVQTAIVVGPENEEIHTDKYGRVKCQFHWDRYGEFNENSSCWIRVSQDWAGKNWGSIYLPRIGQEVIVDFIEGDPDRPIITGRVYNTDNMPPYDLPQNKTQSGIKTRSTTDGTPNNFNEIRFEDKKGEEEFYVQAEKNHNSLIKNNQTIRVGNNRQEAVGQNESIYIGSDRFKEVGHNESVIIQNDRSKQVLNNQSEYVGNDFRMEVRHNHVQRIGNDMQQHICHHHKINIDGKQDTTILETQRTQAQAIRYQAEDFIHLCVGQSELLMYSDGRIQINGQTIQVDSGESIQLQSKKDTMLNAGADLVLKTKESLVEKAMKIFKN